MKHDPSLALKSDVTADEATLCPLQPILGNEPIQLTTAQGISVTALDPMDGCTRACAQDLLLLTRRPGPHGTTELLARFFEVNDEGQAETFDAGWLVATPTPAEYLGPQPETCTFTANAFGYRLRLITRIMSRAMVVSFCEDPATIGIGVCEGHLYVTVSCGDAVCALALVHPGTDFTPDEQPDVSLAQGAAIMLELVDPLDGRAFAARCLRLSAEFIFQLRRALALRAMVGRVRAATPPYTAGVFAQPALIKRIEERGFSEIGDDCLVYSAWISEAEAGELIDGYRHSSNMAISM